MESGELMTDRTYLQCRTARRAGVTSSCTTANITTSKAVISATSQPILGNFGEEDGYSFRGSRISHGGVVVNQSISLSFDPSNMHCLTCHKEHVIVGFGKPTVVCITDQNFVTSISGGGENSCIAVARMEDSDLHDLITFAFELFEKHVVSTGSIIMLGSATHLARVGPTCYAVDWTKCVQRVKSKWPDALLLPLFPIPCADCDTGLARDLAELNAWFTKMYSNSTHGLTSAWITALDTNSRASSGSVTLPSELTYNLAFPRDLNCQSPLVPLCFKTNSSRPVRLVGLDRKTANELVRALIVCLNNDLHLGVELEIDHLLVPKKFTDLGTKDTVDSLVIVGASHMKRTCAVLRILGHNVYDICTPGWVATPPNVAKVRNQISEAELGAKTPIVLDLFSNSVYRFVDYDGTLSMPRKTQTGYHLLGEVTLCENSSISRTMDNLEPLFRDLDLNPKVVVPPQPRYLFDGCCNDPEHSVGVGGDDYKDMNLANLTRIRNLIKSELVARKVKNFWVLDSFSIVGDVKHADHEEVLNHLSLLMDDDGVHFNTMGYTNIAGEIHTAMTDLIAGKIGNVSAVRCGGTPKERLYFWKGFQSLNGSEARLYHIPKAFGRADRGKAGRGGRFHPYRKN